MAPAADADNAVSAGHVIGDRERVSPEFQPIGIEVLRQQLSLTDEQQMPGGGIHGRPIRVEQPLRVESVELADIDAACFRAAGHEEEKVPAVGKELREEVTPLLRRLDSRDGRGFTTCAETRKIGPPGLLPKRIVPSLFHAPPSATGMPEASVRTDPPSMSMRFSLVSAKNPMDRLSGDQNGRDPRSVPGNGRADRRIQRPQPQLRLARGHWPRRQPSVRQAKSPATHPWSEAC